MAFIPRANSNRWTQRTGYMSQAGDRSLILPHMPTVTQSQMQVSDGLDEAEHASREATPGADVGRIRKHNAEAISAATYVVDFEDQGVDGGSMTITGPTDVFYWDADVFFMPDINASQNGFNWWEHYRYIEHDATRLGRDSRIQEVTRTITDGGATSAAPLPKFARYFKAPTVGGRIGFGGFWSAKFFSGSVFTFMGDDYGDDANRAEYNGNGPPYTLASDYWLAWIEITDGGSGYTSEPTVTAANDLGGNSPELRAVINDDGEVVAIWVKDGAQASEYASAPAITISGGGGTGATATAHLSSEISCLAPYTTPTHYAAYHDGTAAIVPMTQPWGRDIILGGLGSTWAKGRDDGNTTWWVGEAFIWGTPNGKLQSEWESGSAPTVAATLHFYEGQVVNMQQSTVFIEDGGTFDAIDEYGNEHLVAGVGSPLGTVNNIPTGSGGAITLPSIAAGTLVVPVIEVESGYPIDGRELAIHIPFETPTPEWAIPSGRDQVVMPAV